MRVAPYTLAVNSVELNVYEFEFEETLVGSELQHKFD